jgi:hypothetical protein
MNKSFCAGTFRMADALASDAARLMAARRWGPRRPIRLAREVAERAAELPTAERVRLQNALALTEETHRQ